jgi:N-acetylglutamate synthase-like GNAT family acetyltransferase
MDPKKITIIDVTDENIDKENICCGFSLKKNQEGYEGKKALMRKRFQEGYRFKKFDLKKRAFVEYVPAEYSWVPIDAPGYMFINCLTVSGRNKNHGFGNRLLEQVIKDSEDKKGIVLITSDKKKPYLADKKFFQKKGFEVFDTAPPYFELMGIRFDPYAPAPKYLPVAKRRKVNIEEGIKVYYTNQCPFADYYADLILNQSREMSLKAEKILVNTNDEARQIPSGYGIFNIFYNGRFLTHEMMDGKKFEKLILSVKDLW